MAARIIRRAGAAVLAALALLGTGGEARAEGTAQLGELQRLREYNAGADNAIRIDILAAGEVITMAACGDTTNRNVRFELYDPGGTRVVNETRNRDGFNMGCDAAGEAYPTAGIDNAIRHVTTQAGRYELRLTNTATGTSQNATSLRRFDVAVTAAGTTAAPLWSGDNTLRGRVSARNWRMIAYAFTETDATDANFYVLTPGGMPSTNYVWQLDFNNVAGFGYDVIANGIGIDTSPSYSAPVAGNSVSPRYDLFLAYPSVALPPPSVAPNVSDFRFRDAAGGDFAIDPASTDPDQQSGTFSFRTDTADATYAVAIDTGGAGAALDEPDGLFGGPGDVVLNGYTADGVPTATPGEVEVSVAWDGTDVNGDPLPSGNYNAEVTVRMGEFHFVGRDIETSGGDAFSTPPGRLGLTIWEMTHPSTGGPNRVPTLVYYDDETLLRPYADGLGRTAASYTKEDPVTGLMTTLPGGAWSNTDMGKHTWGDFPSVDDDTFAEDTFIDTFVYGRARATTTPAAIVPGGTAAGTFTGTVAIDATTVGGTVALRIGDEDLSGDPTVTGVVDNGRGDSVTVTLSEVPGQPGTFEATIPTRADGTPGTALPVVAGDALTLTYTDATTATGATGVDVTDTDAVGGADGVPDIAADVAGQPLQLSVTDDDLTGTTLDVTVLNERTGESEAVTLARTGTTGPFTLALDTTDAAAAGTNDDGDMNVATGDTIRLVYDDALRADGTALEVSDTDTIKTGTAAIVSIDATRVGEPASVTVIDGDRSGFPSITATVSNDDTGGAVAVTLFPRPGSPGVFDGEVATRHPSGPAAVPGTPTLDADAADVLRITYDDTARGTGDPAQPTATDPIGGGTPGVPEIVAGDVGQPLTLRVTDADLTDEMGVTVRVERRATATGTLIGTEIVTLPRTSATGGTGVFELPATDPGALRTLYGTGADGDTADGSINAVAGHELRIVYPDVLTTDGSPADIAATDSPTGGADGTAAITATLVGEPLALRVEDADLATETAVTVIVERRRTATGAVVETETVVLPRTSATGDPGVFELLATATDAVGTTFDANGDPDDANGAMNAVAGEFYTIRYADALAADGSSPDRTDQDDIGGGVTAEPVIDATTIGTPLSLSVEDDDLLTETTLTVTVERYAPGGMAPIETETVVLLRTSAIGDPGVFALLAGDAGAITTAFGAGAAGTATDGAMNAQVGDEFVLVVNDVFRADGSSGTVSVFDTIGGGATATVTLDDVAGGTDETPVGQGIPLAIDDADLTGLTVDAVVERRDAGGTLIETQGVRLTRASASGPFTGTLPTAYGTAGDGDAALADGSINAAAGDVMTLRYADALLADGSSGEITDPGTMTGGTDGTVTITVGTPGEPILVSVSDADLPAGGPDFDVVVRNGPAGLPQETETVTVSWDAGAGAYTGTLPTEFGTADNGTAGLMAVRGGDAITATYSDGFVPSGGTGTHEDTGTVGTGATGTVTIAVGRAGEDAAIVLDDADLPTAVGSTRDVVVENVDTGEIETVTLAYDAGTGTYRGALSTTYGTGAGTDDDGTLPVDALDSLTVTYDDALTATGAPGRDTDTGQVPAGTDGTVSIVAGRPGEDVTLRVEDADLASPLGGPLATVDVAVENLATGETETVTLTETAIGSGVFEADVPTDYGTGAGGAADGRLTVRAPDDLRATYADAYTADGGADPAVRDTDAVVGGNTGTVTLAVGSATDAVTVTLEDPDLAGTGPLAIDVNVSLGAGETETVTLTEGAPGVFTATIPAVLDAAGPGAGGAGTSGDGQLHLRAGYLVTVAYDDALTDDGGTATPTDSGTVGGGDTGVVTIAAGAPGEDAVLTLTDADLASTTGTPATHVVTVQRLVGGTTSEIETVTLTETVAGSGAFTAAVPTRYDDGTGADYDGEFTVVAGDVLRIDYTDALTDAGGPGADDDSAPVTGGDTGVVSVSTGLPGEDVRVALRDDDLAGAGPIRVTLTVSNPDPAEAVAGPATMQVDLVEADPAGRPGEFVALVPSGFRAATGAGVEPNGAGIADDELRIRAGDAVTVDYADAMVDDGEPNVATDDSSTVGGGDTGIVTVAPASPATAVAPGGGVELRLVDDDLAGTGPVDVDVTVVDPVSGDVGTLTVPLTEGDPAGDPGVFTAVLPTGYRAAGDPGVAGGQLRVRAGDDLRVDYGDARTDAGGTGTDTDALTVVGGTLATVFIDAGRVGEAVTLDVFDPDRAAEGFVEVAVVNTATGEIDATVRLDAVPGGGGAFRGTVDTAFGAGAGANDDGAFNASAGDPPLTPAHPFEIRYTDPLDADGGPSAVTATDPVEPGDTGVPTIAATSVGAALDLGLADGDLDGATEVIVTVRNVGPAGSPGTVLDSETVRLTVGTPTTRFDGALATAFPGGTVAANDGTLAATAGDRIEIVYPDAYRRDGSTGNETALATIGGGNDGAVAIDPAPVGGTMPITVADADLDGATAVTVTVTTTYPGGGTGTQTVTLTRDPAVTGVPTFTGGVDTTYGTADDGDPLDASLPVVAGRDVTVTYDDATTATGGPGTATDAAAPTGGTDALAELGPTPVGETVPITLVDPDRIGEGPIPATITNVRTGEVEVVSLTESTDPGDPPGTFVGTLPTLYDPDAGTDGDGTMLARGNDTLALTALDPFGADGGPVATGDVADPPNPPRVTLGTGVTATVGVDPQPVGTPTPITVTDPGRAGPTIDVVVTTPGGTPVTVTLVETSPGLFRGDLPTMAGDGPASVGTLLVEPGAPIAVTYDDPFSATGGRATVTEPATLPNEPPIVAGDTAATAPGEPVSIPVLVNDRDPEGRPLSITAIVQPDPALGSVTHAADGTLVLTPAPGATGTVTFTYTASDPSGAGRTATVTVSIDPLAPTAVPDSAATAPGTPVIVPVLGNDDAPGGALDVIGATAPLDAGGATVGTATPQPDGTVVFDPAPGFAGTATFTYTARDPGGRTDTATVTVTVEADPVVLADDRATTPHDTPATIGLLDNDDPGAHGPLAVTRVTQGASGTVTLDPATGVATYDPDPGTSGTDTFTYEVCDARGICRTAVVTVTVDPPLSAVTGIVWRDIDHDGEFGIAEPLLPGWDVEVLLGGAVVGTDTTDDAGAYRVEGLRSGAGYSVQFRNPNGVVWKVLDGVALTPGATTFDQSLPVDPSGVIYDAVTRELIAGATITMTDASGTPLPGACLLDPSQQSQVTGADGYYRFDVVPGAAAQCPAAETEYRLAVSGSGPGFPSASIVPEGLAFDATGRPGPVEVVPHDTAPTGSQPTTYHLAFRIAPGDPDVVNNHIPLDISARPAVLVAKAALARTASAGTAVPYRITVTNGEANDRIVTVVDTLPPGFGYRDGSSTLNGAPIDARVRGRRVEYRDLVLPANGDLTIGLIAVAGSAVREGEHVNRAHATDSAGTVVSNVATATVSHAPDPDFDCSTVLGRVYVDGNGNGRVDDGEEGLRGVRLVSASGLIVTTGRHGRYHVPCAAVPNAVIGSTMALKLDERTLPLGYRLIGSTHGRNPAMPRLTRGVTTKVNFMVSKLRAVRLDFSAAAFAPGSTALLPDYANALNGLVGRLEGAPSTLALRYHERAGERGGRERLRAVAERAETLWRRAGAPYRLDIERTVTRDLAPRTGRLGTARTASPPAPAALPAAALPATALPATAALAATAAPPRSDRLAPGIVPTPRMRPVARRGAVPTTGPRLRGATLRTGAGR